MISMKQAPASPVGEGPFEQLTRFRLGAATLDWSQCEDKAAFVAHRAFYRRDTYIQTRRQSIILATTAIHGRAKSTATSYPNNKRCGLRCLSLFLAEAPYIVALDFLRRPTP